MTPVITKERDERQQQLVTDAADFAGDVDDESKLIGFVIVALYSDGSSRTGGWRPNAKDHKMGEAMYEAWVRTAVAKHFVYGESIDAAHAVFSGEA